MPFHIYSNATTDQKRPPIIGQHNLYLFFETRNKIARFSSGIDKQPNSSSMPQIQILQKNQKRRRNNSASKPEKLVENVIYLQFYYERTNAVQLIGTDHYSQFSAIMMASYPSTKHEFFWVGRYSKLQTGHIAWTMCISGVML